MKRKWFYRLVLAIGLCGLAACAANQSGPVANMSFAMDGGMQYAAPTSVSAPLTADMTASDGRAQTGALAQNVEPQQRVILKNASLTLVVDDPGAKMEAITTLATEFGGWIVSANMGRSIGDTVSASITIRVPAERLDEALDRIKEGAGKVEVESVNGQDVTQDYVDLSSQIANLRAAETQLQQIMEDARRVDDVLAVYNELVRVRGEIETIQGRLNYYEEAAAFSSIQIMLHATPVTPPVEIGGWRPQETARNAFQALVNVLQGVANILISVAVFGGPLLLIFGLPAWLLLRRRVARRATPAA